MDIASLFKLGMDRDIGSIRSPLNPVAYDCGASGKKVAPGAIPLGLPDWNFPRDQIPARENTVGIVHAYHFMEHLPGETAIQFLAEVQRVLVPRGGIFQFCIPFYTSNLANQDLTHKSFWTEDTFKTLFRNAYYDPSVGKIEWDLRIGALAIMGVAERNLALIGQLVKI
jgi:hypothetical protein